ncbi:MAG TPA: hypothetical protein PK467_17250 [Candidatus Wallbacteria bacterium]|nr:hypothetical protein [Candidatus Wallbacteria bacterium]
MKDIVNGKRILLGLMSRGGMIIFNLFTFAVAIFSAFTLVSLFMNPANNIKEVDDILNAIATIFVGYGVALEERETIFRIFGSVGSGVRAVEEKLNHLSHDYGLMFLVIALFVEITSEIVKIPELTMKTPYLEETMVITGISLTLYLLAQLFAFTIKVAHAADGCEIKNSN